MSTGDEITLREVFDAVLEVKTTLAGMQGHDETLKDHEGRIRALEARQTVSPKQLFGTACALVGLLVGLTVLGKFVLAIIVK